MDSAPAELLFCLDSPATFPPTRDMVVSGWIASPDRLHSVQLLRPDGSRSDPFPWRERLDAAAANPRHAHVRGFEQTLPTALLAGDAVTLVYTVGGREHIFNRAVPHPLDVAAKQRKLDRIAPLLRSDPVGHRELYHYDYLSAELRENYNIVDTAAVSANAYDGIALDLIAKFPDGMVLDAGAGRRGDYLPNVVNLEIVPYASTDVLAVGEELPFRDNAFDAVLTLNVLEHVRDPFRCARELARVLRPGGTLYAAVPFLQHYHGYPHHYYNMTHQGLANLFGDLLEIKEQKVLASGAPIWTLSWFLQIYHAGLPAEERAKFAEMRIADFLPGPEPLLQKPFVTQLSEEANFQIASTTMLVATKPAAS